MTFLHLFEFKAAIQLNNIGVLLADRHHLESAAKCFKDAITVMKMASSSCSCSSASASASCSVKRVGDLNPLIPSSYIGDDVGHHHHHQGIMEMLQTSAHLLSRAKFQHDDCSRNQIVPIVAVISDMDNPLLTVSNNNNNNNNSNNKSSSSTSTDGLFQMIRMDLVDFEWPNANDWAIESSILLYNYAIVYFCLASSKTSSPYYSRLLREGGMSLLVLSYNNMVARFNPQGTRSDMVSSLAKVFLVNVLILNQLATQSKELGMNDESKTYTEHLNNIKRLIMQDSSLELTKHRPTAGAA